MSGMVMRKMMLGTIALATAACGAWVSDDDRETGAVAGSPTQEALPEAIAAGAAVRLEVAPSGNEVRYRVREQLVNVDLPNDAIGRTSGVRGGITLDSSGAVIPGASRFVIEVAGLKSDRDRRDGYVSRRLLETEQHPTVVLAPTAIQGLTLPLPTSGTRVYDLTGDLTIKGVTRPTTWRVSANFKPDTVTGSATTKFTFSDFQLTQPRVPVLLSVADTIGLEYDFALVMRDTP